MSSSDQDDGGYVLAAALVSLVIIAILVTTLLTVSAHELSRVQRFEREVVMQTYLEGRLTELAAAVSSGGAEGLQLVSGQGADERSETSLIGLEDRKIDINLSDDSVILRAGRAAGIDEAELMFALEQLARLRAAEQPARLVDDVVPAGSLNPECFHRIFTVFGGSTSFDLENFRMQEQSRIASLAPGARVWLAVNTADRFGPIGRFGVLLVTGDTNAPVIWLDSRPTTGVYCDEF